jgi:hypothetical protein
MYPKTFVFLRCDACGAGYCILGNLSIYISILFSKRGAGSLLLIRIRFTIGKSKIPDRMDDSR